VDAVAIFASPEGTHAVLGALAGTDIPLVLLSGASRDPASFSEIALPEGMLVTGTTPVSTLRSAEAFDAAYLDLTGEEATDTARQAYDAVYIAALAAMGANSTAGEVLRNASLFVANPPGEVLGPADFGRAGELVTAGQDVNYTGISGFVDMTASGALTKGAVEVWRYVGAEILPIEKRDVDAAAEVGAEVPTGNLVRSGDLPALSLMLGVISETDDLGDPVDPAGVGAFIAVSEINDAGGAFGQDVELLFEAPSQGAAQVLLEQGANVIMGPVDPASAQAALDASAESGVPVFAFVTSPEAPLGVLNIAPSEALQGVVLANLAVEQGNLVACVLHEGGAGGALAEAFKNALEFKEGRVGNVISFTGDEDFGEIVNNCISS
jgi:ABC-type branched-subunit amino acid transport system substrate-binding protein